MKILLIDDDSNDRIITIHELNKNIPGIEFTEIWEKKQFIEILKDFSFDLVLTDYYMRGWDGIYVLKAVKALNSDIPVIMYTGTGNEEIAVEAMKLGLDDYILKGKKRIIRLSSSLKAAVKQMEEVRTRRKIEKEFKKTAKQIHLLLDSTAEGIFSISTDGAGTLINKAALKMLRIDQAANILGKNIHDLIHHSDHVGNSIPFNKCPIFNTVTEKKLVHRVNDIFWRTDNTCFPVEYWAYPITEYDQVVGSVITFFDISDKVRTQQKLSEALTKAEQAVMVKNNFLANISHEIRTPLNAIIGFSDVLSKLFETKATREEQSYFQIVNKACDRLMHTVHEILDISTIEAGAYEIFHQELDLVKLLDDCVEKWKKKADLKNISLHWVSSVSNAPIYADKYCITQSLENLIENAIKYTDKGKIDIRIIRTNPWFILIIEDTGVGISKDYLSNIFDIFSQESEGYSKKYQGVGLGLSLVKRYIDLCNVDMSVESELGAGTKFTLKFKQYNIKNK